MVIADIDHGAAWQRREKTQETKHKTQNPSSATALTFYEEQVEAPQGLSFEVNGGRFLMVSGQPDFLQGRSTFSENYKKLDGIQDSLKHQRSLLIDLQGEMLLGRSLSLSSNLLI